MTWVPELSMNITLRFDALAAIMSVLVLGIGALVLFYCADYFHHHDGHTEKRLPSFAAELVAFSGAMFGLVCSDNMLLLYVFWELTTVLSFLLVGHYAERATSRRAATQALLVTTFGGLAMLVGIVVLGNMSGTYLLSELIAAPPTGLAASVGVVLVLIGALAKSAIVPMHFWLPGAMAAPTPVSAYLHAAAMVKAGVYLVARMTPGFADSPPWRPTVVILGLLTMLLAGWRAVREYDLKLILAFGTVSQLGLITVMVGAGGGDLMLAGLAMLCAHAMFKAVAVHGRRRHRPRHRHPRHPQAGLARAAQPTAAGHRRRRDREHGRAAPVPRLRRQGGRLRNRRCTAPSLGAAAPYVLAGIVLGSVFTTIYSLRFLCGSVRPQGITGTQQAGRRNAPSAKPPSSPRPRSWPPRAWCSACGRRRPRQRARRLRRHGAGRRGLPPRAVARRSVLPLLLSALVLAVGTAAYFGRGPAAAAADRPHNRWATPTASTTRRCGAWTVVSVRLTAVTQRGSIPATQSVILSHAGAGARDRPRSRRPRSPPLRVVGLAACRSWSGC